MKVATAKDRLEKRGEIYLDAELDFRDEKNFAVVITKTGAAKLKEAGIDDPADHFRDKTIRASGIVKVVDEVPRIEIDEAKQIRQVESTAAVADEAIRRVEKQGGSYSFDKEVLARIHLGGTKANDDDLVAIGKLPISSSSAWRIRRSPTRACRASPDSRS